jgi:hypothetical protein
MQIPLIMPSSPFSMSFFRRDLVDYNIFGFVQATFEGTKRQGN